MEKEPMWLTPHQRDSQPEGERERDGDRERLSDKMYSCIIFLLTQGTGRILSMQLPTWTCKISIKHVSTRTHCHTCNWFWLTDEKRAADIAGWTQHLLRVFSTDFTVKPPATFNSFINSTTVIITIRFTVWFASEKNGKSWKNKD